MSSVNALRGLAVGITMLSLAAMTIYGCGLVVTFGASALYHWLGGEGPRRNAALRCVDHASIYVMIACSYTPVLYFGLAGAWRSATIASVWLLTAVGVASTIWFVGAPRALSTTFYVALGWVAIVPAAKLAATLSHEAIALIVTGGLLYSIGGIIYATRSFAIFCRDASDSTRSSTSSSSTVPRSTSWRSRSILLPCECARRITSCPWRALTRILTLFDVAASCGRPCRGAWRRDGASTLD